MNTRKTRISIIWMALALVVGAIAVSTVAVPQLEAAPIRSKLSQQERVKIQSDLCTDLGGTIEVTETTTKNSSGRPHAITTECTGGAGDGTYCVNTEKHLDCWQVLSVPTRAPFGDLPDIDDAHTADLPEATPLVPNREDSILPEEIDPGTFEPSPTPSPNITDQENPGPTEDSVPGLPDPTPTPASARPTVVPVLDPLD